jgi:hypothetical protein
LTGASPTDRNNGSAGFLSRPAHFNPAGSSLIEKAEITSARQKAPQAISMQSKHEEVGQRLTVNPCVRRGRNAINIDQLLIPDYSKAARTSELS